MLILSGLGLRHARRTSPETEILSGHPAHAQIPATHPGNQLGADDDLVAASPGTSPSVRE
jgi:hypothetical protein